MIQWVLPSVDPTYREACLGSLATNIRERVLVIDNTHTNRGVAASWNLGLARAVSVEADWLVLMSEAVRFKEAGGADLETALNDDTDSLWVDLVGTGWHLVAFRTHMLRRVGRWDENFWPAYFEDTDYLVRMHLAGYPSPRLNDRPGRRLIAGLDVYDAGTEHSITTGLVGVNFTPLVDYYRAKWGATPPEYRYPTPFNNPGVGWGWWPARQPDRVGGMPY